MKAAKIKQVIDLYEWLPPRGELLTRFRFEDGDLHVEASYEDDADDSVKSKAIVFTSVCWFLVSSFPGLGLVAIQYDNSGSELGRLEEYEESEAARAWTEHFGSLRQVRHYKLFFLNENLCLEVFAEDCHLQDIAAST